MRRARDQISAVKPFEGRRSDSCRDPAMELPAGDASRARRCANTRSVSENNCIQTSHSPLARALEAPLRGARFDGYTLPVAPERVKSWITRRFHRDIVSPEPSDAQSALCALVSECASSCSPPARALDAPSRGARFDGYAVPVTPERFFWWTERRFHHLMAFPEPSGAQAPAPRPHRRVWKLSFTPGESARRPVAGGSFRRLRGSSDAGAILLVDQATVPPPHDVYRAGRCASTRSAPAQTCVEGLVHASARVLARPSPRVPLRRLRGSGDG